MSFGIADFSMNVYGDDGEPDGTAGDHPYSVVTGYDLNSSTIPGTGSGSGGYLPIQEPKSITVELPLGLVGSPSAAALCPEADLATKPEPEQVGNSTSCPADSRIGTIVLARQQGYQSSQEWQEPAVSPIYDIEPEAGYPAVFGFRFLNAPVLMYTSVVPTARGYRFRMTVPNIPHGTGGYKVLGAIFTFFGEPASRDAEMTHEAQVAAAQSQETAYEEEHGGEKPYPKYEAPVFERATGPAFFTNPTSCSDAGEQEEARIEVNSWVDPERTVEARSPVYSGIAECNMLQFNPSLEVQPQETVQADTPSGYEVDLKIPQTDGGIGEMASPSLKDVKVTLPEGVNISPSSADGLGGCTEAELGPLDTELGDGYPGGNDSPYGDGLEHPAPGHCPANSQLGDVEALTPLLPQPLKGHVYLAQPQCGGDGQRGCEQSDATNGDLFGLYLEFSGSGVIVKLHGKVSANPQTGQLTTVFEEDPQLPFSELKLLLHGGSYAPIVNPQACGSAVARSELTPWGGSSAFPASPAFGVIGCGSSMPFGPSFAAGTVSTTVGGFTPFTITLSRKDGEQDLGGVSVALPPGVMAMLAKVPFCDEAQANAGSCSSASRIGTTTVAAGAGATPFWLSGPVYLTGPYKGAPFGLSVVVPAIAGPFNLGDVVERVSIDVDPKTAQVTLTSDPLPQIRDGVPLRLKTLNVTVDRPEFLFNPTNCSGMHVTGTVTGDMPDGSTGTTTVVSSPFAATGCKHLAYKPRFSVSADSKFSRRDGVALTLKITPAAGQSNTGKMRLVFPKQIPTRLSTLKLACTAKVFETNPATCPAGSQVGTATARTPILGRPLAGPIYLVSHGGAGFPDVEIVLQGEGVTLSMDGRTDIVKGITSSTFGAVPDVPFSTFEAHLPQGPHSAFAAIIAGNATGNLCGKLLSFGSVFVAQNGVQLKRSTKVSVSGCHKVKSKGKSKSKAKTKIKAKK